MSTYSLPCQDWFGPAFPFFHRADKSANLSPSCILIKRPLPSVRTSGPVQSVGSHTSPYSGSTSTTAFKTLPVIRDWNSQPKVIPFFLERCVIKLFNQEPSLLAHISIHKISLIDDLILNLLKLHLLYSKCKLNVNYTYRELDIVALNLLCLGFSGEHTYRELDIVALNLLYRVISGERESPDANTC
ncbi:hypothetical protein BT93_K0751 [Corymbia citriodora subsp. variegata]|nr:hypothetical protein BT93_K0751 [Corymbia citriodora subsp. variegata]